MMSTMKNIPKLRFPEFSGEWEANRLAYVCEMRAGKFMPAESIKADRIPKSYPCYGGNGLRGYVKSHTHSGDYSLIGRQGALCGNVKYVSGGFYATEHAVVVYPKLDISNKWLFYQLNRLNLNRFATGQAQPGLSVDTILNIKQFNPTKKTEQEKIAGFLTVVDERISLIEKNVELLKQYKKGIMQKIFTQQIRFNDEKGQNYSAWKDYRLGDIGTTYTGLTGKTADDFGTGSNFVTYMQIFSDSRINLDKFGQVKISANEQQNKVRKGDIFFTTSSETPQEVGFTSVLLDEVDNTYLNSFCFGYRVNDKILLPKFSQYLFHDSRIRNLITRLAQGSTRYNLSKNELMKQVLKLPIIEEQQKIADYLTVLDNKINAEDAKLTQAKQFKKCLLQRMFV